jgi:hypothetical protein
MMVVRPHLRSARARLDQVRWGTRPIPSCVDNTCSRTRWRSVSDERTRGSRRAADVSRTASCPWPSAARPRHQRISSALFSVLKAYVATRGLGEVLYAMAGRLLDKV